MHAFPYPAGPGAAAAAFVWPLNLTKGRASALFFLLPGGGKARYRRGSRTSNEALGDAGVYADWARLRRSDAQKRNTLKEIIRRKGLRERRVQ